MQLMPSKLKKSKAGLQLGDLYQFVLIIIVTAFLVGVGALALAEFMGSDAVSTNTEAVNIINGTLQSLVPIGTTWMGLIVTIGILSIVMGLIIGGFMYFKGNR